MKIWRNRLALLTTALLSASVMADKIALTNVNLVDVQSLKIKPGQTIVIEDDRIQAIAASGSMKLGDDTVTVNLEGKYVTPGLIDAHLHHGTAPEYGDSPEATTRRLRALLRGGITSIRDMGGDIRVLRQWQRQAQLDLIQSPDMYYSVIIGGEEFFADPRTIASARGEHPGHVDWMRAVDDNTDFDALMQRTLGTGATGIKIYAKVPAHLVKKLADSAKRHGVKVWSHVYIGPDKPSAVVNAGVETISHVPDLSAEVISNYENWRRKDQPISDAVRKASFDPASYKALFDAMLEKGTILDASLTVFERLKNRNNNSATVYEHTKFLAKLAHQAGVKIAAGTDFNADNTNIPYPMLHHEMQLLVNDAGMSPLQALQAATLHSAEAIGIDKETGTIAVGKKANLVVMNADPSKDIKNTIDIAHVIKNGQFIYRGDDARLPFVSARKAAGMLWMSGQIGNFPGTMVLASDSIEGQMHQTMQNIGAVLQENGLDFSDVVKCTLMLGDIKDWQKASAVYKEYFPDGLPTRSAFAAAGLALNAKAEVECLAAL